MTSTRRIRKIVSVVLLFSVFWFIINSVAFRHYHQLSTGNIITHAHPYQPQKSDNYPFQSHPHSNMDYIILSLICDPFFCLTAIFIAVFLFFPAFKIIQSILEKFYISREYTWSYTYRGPPPTII